MGLGSELGEETHLYREQVPGMWLRGPSGASAWPATVEVCAGLTEQEQAEGQEGNRNSRYPRGQGKNFEKLHF